MCKKGLLLLTVICLIFIFGCVSEDIGRRVDPGYDNYLNHRTYTQELEDKKKQEEIKRESRNQKNNEEAMKEFNDRVKLKAPK